MINTVRNRNRHKRKMLHFQYLSDLPFLENKEKDDVFHENRKKITEELIGEDCKFLDDETIKKYYDAEIPGRYIAL